MTKCIGCYSCMLACARTVRRSLLPGKAAIQIKTAGGYQSKFIADICRGCIDAPCSSVCCSGALTVRPGGGVRFKADKCISCRECVNACVFGILHFDEDSGKPLVCIQCGTCVKFCPHQVLTMEVKTATNKQD